MTDTPRTTGVEESLAEERFRAIAEINSLMVWRAAPNGRPLGDCEWQRFLGDESDPDDGERWIRCLHPDDQAPVRSQWRQAFRRGTPFEAFYRVRQPQGDYRWCQGRGTPLTDTRGVIREWIGTVADVHDKFQAVNASVVNEERLKVALDVNDLGIWDHDLESDTFWASEVIARMTGLYPSREANPRQFWHFVHPEDRYGVRQVLRAALAGAVTGHFELQFRAHRHDQERLALIGCSARLIFNDQGRPVRVVGVFRDISEEQEEQVQLYYEAHYDSLTGLRNRKLFTEQAQALFDQGGGGACLLLELDGFQEARNTLGQEASNRLLQLTAHRLSQALPDATLLARLTGEEFIALVPGQHSRGAVLTLAESIHAALLETFMVSDRPVALSGHVGAAVAPGPGADARALIDDAHLALADAKATGYSASRIYRPALREALRLRQDMSAELRRAALGEEFELYYQPQVSLDSGRIVGAEALLRWNHPERGLLTPNLFLPLLKRSPMARIVGDWVVAQACEAGARLHAQGRPLRLAVNLFSAQFKAGGVEKTVARELERHALPARWLEIEITERVIINNDHSLRASLQALREQGCELAFDDFGTGYASLSMLKDFPLTRLKVDKSFIDGIPGSTQDNAVVSAMVQLAATFGFQLTAEGIEHPSQASTLKQWGCQEGQGYLFGKPMPWAELVKALDGQGRRG
ncbi:putative bifunctional diguanylate cyclase/phosphodiesterase [Alloalcanivorax mobilis]|uniref:putative bifunctional diguanylate cyclase/phosphodiesterase n=1 Tax=Alloalcanivorax mobilis TaxID=2019569 RepID=UPI0018E48308|nr:GGDEF domain-containing phosphodiesterase [Alloalcanivorax mobilis]